MSRFTTILWDVDGTLLDFLYAQRLCMQNCFKAFGHGISEEQLERYSAINDSYWKRLELGLVTKDELLIGRFKDFLKELHISDIDAGELRSAYEEGLGEIYKYNENSYEVCGELFGKVKQYIITNGISATQRNKIRLSGLDRFMEDIFVSEEAGFPKPFAGFFDYCMERIEEKDKSRILIVGDSLTSDIKGGVTYGIPTCWYRPQNAVNTSEYRPDYEIGSLEEIMEILGEG
jgi:2-haloacid dehalogenase